MNEAEVPAGITLREFIAGQALQGCIIAAGLSGAKPEEIASRAIQLADALLIALKK